MSAEARVRPVGDGAVTIELGPGIDAATSARVRALDAAFARTPLPGVIETVPTFRSLLVVFDPDCISAADVAEAAQVRLRAPAAAPEAPTVHEVPAVYGGEHGPDLAAVAQATGLEPARVVERHAGREYTALMLGFMPGFAYLGLLDPALALPRRATPRARVPAGSVAIAAGQTAVYPAATPGGWHLIGRTSLTLFDPTADPPVRIRAGDRVRFVPTDILPARDVPAPARPPGPAAFEVVEAGVLTTVQDAGRTGWRRFGVSGAGAMDPGALAEANRAVGNAVDAAALECTLTGPSLRFLAPVRFAVAGGGLGAVLYRADLGAWPVPPGVAVRARAGNVLTLSAQGHGCRAYVAFAGGIAVPAVLGSRATDLAGGFGGLEGRPLRAGDVLAVGLPPAPAEAGAAARPAATGDVARLRVLMGPQDDHFTAEVVERFLTAEYRVQATSDRVGCRLDGPPLPHAGASEIPSDGMVPGCVQVPPDGQPIVMGADGPTTGGYPKIATVIRADRPLLAQLVPGRSRVRFEAVTAAALRVGP